METKAERLAKVERLYEAIEKAKASLILEQAKEWLKGFIGEPWYDAAVKAYVDIVSACGRILDDLKRRILKAIRREDLYNDLTDVEAGAATTAATGAAAAGATTGTSAAQTITYYKTWEYLDERYNHVVVDDVRDELIELQRGFQQQLEEVYQKQLADKLIPQAGKDMYQSLDMDFDFNKFDEATRDYLRDKKIHWSKQVAEETEREIKAQLVKGYEAGVSSYDLADAIKSSTGFSMHRAEAIARTEVLSACEYASYQVALADDNIVGHYWRAQNSSRTRSTHRAANGQYRPKGEPFDVGGAQLLFPGDSSLGAPAKEVINCRCHLKMVFADEAGGKKAEYLQTDASQSREHTAEEVKKYVDEEFDMLPKKHQKILEKKVQKVLVDNAGPSGYYKGEIYLTDSALGEKGVLIHEAAHALEEHWNIYHDKEFLGVLQSGFDDAALKDVIIDSTGYVDQNNNPIQIMRLKDITNKFVSTYQSRLYQEDVDGEVFLNGSQVNVKCLREYFSEGYKTFIMEPELLKARDPELYDYINNK